MNLFDFLNSVNDTKIDVLKQDPHAEKDYSAFMVNRGLSFFHDSIMFANEMNINHSIPKMWQYDFYLHGLTKRKRFSKWHKKESYSDDHIIRMVAKEYNYSLQRASEVLNILTDKQKEDLLQKYNIGGKVKSK